MIVRIEVQLLRDWMPRSRPSPGILRLGESTPSMVKLYPGASAYNTEEMIAILEESTRWDVSWCAVVASFRINAIPFAEARPTSLYLGPSSEWSGVVHFPRMANRSNKLLSGIHSLLIRCVSNGPA